MRTNLANVLFLVTLTLGAGVGPALADLRIEHNPQTGTLAVYRAGSQQLVLRQHAKPGFRPYLHPIMAPDGRGVLTESSPSHHPHQTGLYWGFTRVNGRDYFHHPGSDYWRRVAVTVLQGKGGAATAAAQWQTVYDLLDAAGQVVLTETQIWTVREEDREYVLDLQWTGEAKVDITISKYDYGGLFLRMPWRPGIRGAVVNGARQRNQRAEGQRAPWVDVGMQIEGRDDLAHIAIFDHSKNPGFPQPWRVDSQFGVGPVRARLGDWQIARGEKVAIRHQLRVYTGELNDLALTNKWGRFSGQRGTWSLWGLARQEGRSAKFLQPQEAVEAMTVQPEFTANVWAAEPMMTQPMAFCWDDRGRMWIAENRDYESRGRGFSNSGDSRIVILEDTDRDGAADRRTVFSEGIPFPSALAVGMGGVWLGAPPNLLFLPDRDGDDKADADAIEVRLTGWGIRDRHETINSLHWGPDGWLYGCQGFATPSQVGKPLGKGRLYRHQDPFPRDIQFRGATVDINGGVWRYHPTKDRFEVVAHGFSNPWGIDYNAKGQLFITACVIPHLWHVIPGGIYQRQGGRHFNPHVYRDIQTITDHRHRSAHGGARVYLSDAFPQRYRHQLFMANIHEHAVLTDVLEPQGSGFVGRHGEDFLLANNAQWIGFSMEIGPEGAVYVLDWHDADICGTEVLNKDTGRIFRIAAKNSAAQNWPGRYADLAQFSDDKLIALQRSASAWHARRARVLLQARAASGQLARETHAGLRALFQDPSDPDHRLRAMWALHITGGLTAAQLTAALDDADEYIRSWAIQLLCEDQNPPPTALQRFAQLAVSDPSAVVRLYLAAALQRLAHPQRWEIATALVAHAEDAEDHNLPQMLWFGIEPLVAAEPARALALARHSRIPQIARFVARRLVDADAFEAVAQAVGVTSPVQRDLLLGMRDGMEGRFDLQPPPSWNTVYAKLQTRQGEVAALAVQLAQQFGDTVADEKMFATLRDGKAPLEDRRTALRALSQRKRPELRTELVSLLEDDALRREAIRAMASFADRRLGTTLLARYERFDQAEKLEVIHTMASRSRYGRQLTQAIQRGQVPKQDVPAYVARLLRRVVGNSFVEVWGPIDELGADQQAVVTKYRQLLTDEALGQADPRRGRAVFQKTCLQCHKLYGEGGQIGPDITGANRTNLDYLLGNILTPSAVIQDAYKMHVVLTDEGRVYNGILAGENERQIQLRVAGKDQPVTIPKSAIESREIAPISMMPLGLWKNLTDAQVLDLVAYLRTPRQVPLPGSGQ